MLTEWFLTINEWITGAFYLAALGCFLWGVVSVLFSPCHLASIPLIVAYVAGQDQALKPRQAAQYAVLFTAGLFITIAVIGVVCALLGRMLGDVGSYWQVAVGIEGEAGDAQGVRDCRVCGACLSGECSESSYGFVAEGEGVERCCDYTYALHGRVVAVFSVRDRAGHRVSIRCKMRSIAWRCSSSCARMIATDSPSL